MRHPSSIYSHDEPADYAAAGEDGCYREIDASCNEDKSLCSRDNQQGKHVGKHTMKVPCRQEPRDESNRDRQINNDDIYKKIFRKKDSRNLVSDCSRLRDVLL